jgi:signal transduction histidine kinase
VLGPGQPLPKSGEPNPGRTLHRSGRPLPRPPRPVVNFFVERRWWQFIPIPLAIATFALYRGPHDGAGGYGHVFGSGAVLVLSSAVLIAARPREATWWGITSMVAMCLSGGLFTVAIPSGWTISVPYLVASVAARRYRPRTAAVVVVSAAASIVITQIGEHGSALTLVASLAILVALTMTTFARRTRADRLEQVEVALAHEQAAREEHTRAAALAERARIAREVHDVLAHSLSALSLNLQGARLMLDREEASEQVREQVRRAQRLAAEGLSEARRAVAALREDPLPAARAIADLVTGSRLETGTPTELSIEGTPRDLPSAAEDALFRTAQESLSNARKYAAGAPVQVRLAYLDGRTELTVTDHQGHRPADPNPGGYGLTGMRERAELIGGELSTGPIDDGWQVRLVVPA